MTELQAEPGRHVEQTAPAEAWDAIAALYDEHVAPGESELATVGLRLAGLKEGDAFLDVAAGPGGLSLPAARLGARVLATDWSPEMIARFNARYAAMARRKRSCWASMRITSSPRIESARPRSASWTTGRVSSTHFMPGCKAPRRVRQWMPCSLRLTPN